MSRGLPPAVLLGGGPIAVPVARSLAARGVRVVALGHPSDPVRRSRACARFVDTGADAGVQDRWLAWLEARSEPEAVLLPCHDEALELVARTRAHLVALGYRPMEADDRVVLAMLDKRRTYELAREAGVAAPATADLPPDADPLAAAAGLQYPLGLKPRRSHEFARHFGLSTKLFLALDEADLVRHHRRVAALGLDMLLTEVVPGPDDAYHSYYTWIDERGEPLFHLTKRKLRQYPPGFGLATYHRIHRDPEVMEEGLRFFRHVGLRGLGCVEFKRDVRDGRLVVIECNHRFTAGTEVVRRAGVDLAQLAYGRLTDGVTPPLGAPRVGVRMWHPVEDVRWFLSQRPGGMSAAAYVRSLAHRQHFPIFAWSDPRPSLDSWARFPRHARRRLRRAARGAPEPRPASPGPGPPPGSGSAVPARR